MAYGELGWVKLNGCIWHMVTSRASDSANNVNEDTCGHKELLMKTHVEMKNGKNLEL